MSSCKSMIEIGRRQFLRGAVAGAGLAATAAEAAPARDLPARDLARVAYPARRLANLGDLKVGVPVEIAYPDADSPGVLLKFGHAVEGGTGPGRDIVGFSTLCPHRGFPLVYGAQDKSFNCRHHYSRFDAENEGQQIWGHATQNLAQFRLRVDARGDIHAEGIDELVYGRVSNVLQGRGREP